LGRSFTETWDKWLREGILTSRNALASRWLDTYLTSPLWRFALGPGSCGPNTVVGVLMPSVDAVGRYFPLMVGRELDPGLDLGGFLPRAFAWYQAVEYLALATLQPKSPLELLDEPLALEVPPPRGISLATEVPDVPCQHIVLDGASDPAEFCRNRLDQGSHRQTLWWTAGSAHITPCLLICGGMPAADKFTAMLDGTWRQHGWTMTTLAASTRGDCPG